MTPSEPIRVAIIDNSIDPAVYTPVVHWAAHLNVPWEAFRAPDGRLPDRDGFSHFILSGSEASILDLQPWVADEIAFVQEVFNVGKSLLGSCYGHQLLARALAGPAHVGSCREPEIGWIPVDVLPAAAFPGPTGPAYSFALHFDEVRDLPADRFEILASTPICPVQGFAVRGRNVLGFQIHPEIDPQAGEALLRGVVETRGRGWSGCAAALGQSRRDSGLISRIVNVFFRFSP
jgi:GMP synthase-like glutamine amidotransferase